MNVAILLSGGTGTRLGGDIPKQYIEVAGQPIIAYSLEALMNCEMVDAICVVAAPEWQQEIRTLYEKLETVSGIRKPLAFSLPGETRQLSIVNALRDVEGGCCEPMSICAAGDMNDDAAHQVSTVLIHDAARPNLFADLLKRIYGALAGHDGVLPTLPMKDTVYLSESGGQITGLLDRKQVFAGQAPELFRFLPYKAACDSLLAAEGNAPAPIYQINGSTEPAILAGLDIAMVQGDERNYKITTAEDLKRFEADMTYIT